MGTQGGLYRGTTQRVHIGIARAPPLVLPGSTVSLQALQALPGPSAHLQLPHPLVPTYSQYGRDSIKYILKLVNMGECRLKSMMRPAILPISKTGT